MNLNSTVNIHLLIAHNMSLNDKVIDFINNDLNVHLLIAHNMSLNNSFNYKYLLLMI